MSKQFIVEPAFSAIFPESRIGTIVVRNINNAPQPNVDFAPLLADGMKEAQKHLTNPEFIQNPAIGVWREAFKQFKTKKGARSSIEALLKRINNGNPVGTINPLVDLYNYISMKYAIPCGGETLDAIQGNLRLTVAEGGEHFLPLGAEGDEPALPGEVIYRDDFGAVCRCFNWREAQRTMLTEETTDAFLCMELVDRSRAADLDAALSEMKDLILKHLGGTAEIQILDGSDSVGIG